MVDHCQEAREWLEALREGYEDYEVALTRFCEEAQKGGLSLTDLGTSEEELNGLRILGCTKATQEWLESLRGGYEDYEVALRHFREEARKGGLSLADLGTSEQELNTLRTLGCKTAAQKWLEALRNGYGDYEASLMYLRKEAEKGGLSLGDIGTSEEELARLAR